MQTVQFSCGRCGKLIGVSSQHLGQQVCCPHCQQVVLAPPPSATASEAPSPEGPPLLPAPPGSAEATPSPPASAAEDIFSSVDAGSDLFGQSIAPRLEMPADFPALSVPSPQRENIDVWPRDNVSPAASFVPLQNEGDKERDVARHASAQKQTQAKAPWFLLLVFCPVLLYSIVISIFAFLLYRHDQQLQEKFRERFDAMPDVGDDPGVRKGKRISRTDKYKPELATLPLPDSLCTTLGKPLRIGDLQVTPNRVERKRVSVIVGATRPEPCRNDSLVLYLDLKNLSSEYAFAPLDNYFDRYWRPGMDLIPPLTLLEIGSKYRCYGGPARWYPRGDPVNPREWVKGRHEQADLLQPGEEKQMFVCTDGDDDKAAAVLFGDPSRQAYHGPFLWRVRVRRGLVHFQGKDYSATAVIGVRFTDADIRQAAPDA